MNGTTAEVNSSLVNILERGILRIRSCAWIGNAPACGCEADHIHNIPEILRNARPSELLHYFDITRKKFIKNAELEIEDFRDDWAVLDVFINAHIRRS